MGDPPERRARGCGTRRPTPSDRPRTRRLPAPGCFPASARPPRRDRGGRPSGRPTEGPRRRPRRPRGTPTPGRGHPQPVDLDDLVVAHRATADAQGLGLVPAARAGPGDADALQRRPGHGQGVQDGSGRVAHDRPTIQERDRAPDAHQVLGLGVEVPARPIDPVADADQFPRADQPSLLALVDAHLAQAGCGEQVVVHDPTPANGTPSPGPQDGSVDTNSLVHRARIGVRQGRRPHLDDEKRPRACCGTREVGFCLLGGEKVVDVRRASSRSRPHAHRFTRALPFHRAQTCSSSAGAP